MFQEFSATIVLVMRSMTFTGPQIILSPLLGVDTLRMEPKTKKTTTNHIAILPMESNWLNAKPDLIINMNTKTEMMII